MGFGISFHLQNVVLFWNVLPFPKFERFCECCFSFCHSWKQKSVHSLQIALLMRLWTNNEMYIKLLHLFQLSRIYNLLNTPILVREIVWKRDDPINESISLLFTFLRSAQKIGNIILLFLAVTPLPYTLWRTLSILWHFINIV